MASPQKEDGFTPIANEIMEALAKYRIPGEQMQCLMYIIRKTYGYQKKKDSISLSQFAKATGITRRNVVRALNGLVKKGVVKKDTNSPVSYQFNKHYTNWKVVSKKTLGVSKKSQGGVKKEYKSGVKKDTYKRKKENIQKKGKKFIPPSLLDVKNYFQEKGYKTETAEKAFEFYNEADWHDSNGKKIKSWKQKMVGVWFRSENKETKWEEL